MLTINTYKSIHQQGIVNVILPVQQFELGVSIALSDQPDLLDIENFYCQGYGNFWVALDGEEVVGTIAMIDIGNQQACLRKMFVKETYRGKEYGTAQLLMDALNNWCKEKGVNEIYLGTIDIMHAAQRFYVRNGFAEIAKEILPANFPLMKVDNRFYKKKL